MIARTLRPAVTLLLGMTVALGLIYPMVITAVARVAFPLQAAGSLKFENGNLAGSRLIGQHFTEPHYFWGRPSATGPQPNNGLASGGSNLGPLNPALLDQVRANIEALRAADPGNRRMIPVDLITASASGLDPEISPAAAAYQAKRIAQARGLPLAEVENLIATHRQGRWLGFIGEPRINVLELNIALDHNR